MDAGEYWQRRFEQYDSQVRSLFVRTVEIVSIGLTVLAAVMGLAISSENQEMLVFIPAVVLLLWAVAARFIDEQLLACAYRDYAELQAARHMGVGADPLASWWVTGAPLAQKGFVNYYLFILLGSLSLAIIVISLWVSPCCHSPILGTMIIVGTLIMVALGAWSFGKALIHHREARKPVENLLAELQALPAPTD